MNRLPDWEPRLIAYIDSVARTPFEWGVHDCALHGANAVLALTGVDHGAAFRNGYIDAAGAAAALRAHGAGTLVRTFTAILGKPVHRARGQRGDLVLAGGSIGVVMGAHALFAGELGDAPGLVPVPRDLWTCVWKVG